MRTALCELVPGALASVRFESRAAKEYAALIGIERDLQWVRYAAGFLHEQLEEGESATDVRSRAVFGLTNHGLTWYIVIRYFRCFSRDSRSRMALNKDDALRNTPDDLRAFHEGLKTLRDTAFAHAGDEAQHHGLLIVLRDHEGNPVPVASYELEEPGSMIEPEQAELMTRLVEAVLGNVQRLLATALDKFDHDLSRLSAGYLEELAAAGQFAVPQQTAFAFAQRLKDLGVDSD